MFKTLLLSTLLLLTPQLVMADAKQELFTQEKAISKIMNLSGLNTKVPEISKELITSFDPYVKQLTKSKSMKLSISLSEAFDKDMMLAIIKDEIIKSISLEDALPIISWYQSDLGKEISKIEAIATHEQNVEALTTEKYALLSNQDKVNLTVEMDKQAHITDFLLNTQIEVIRASYKVTQPTINAKALDDSFDNMRKEVRNAIEETTILSLLKAYEKVDIEKMKKYVTFLSRPTTQKFLLSGYDGIAKAIVKGTDKVVKEVATFK